MSTFSRTFCSLPARSALDTWSAIINILAPTSDSDSRKELESLTGVVCSLIADGAMVQPIIVYGNGPRVRIYCLYNDGAIEGEKANENSLNFVPTDGDWKISLPCPKEELSWIVPALAAKSSRVTARDMATGISIDDATVELSKATAEIDMEGFLRK